MILELRVIDGEDIVKISRDVVKHVYKVVPFRFMKVKHKTPLITKKQNKSAMSGAHFVPIGIPTIRW